jgi:tetratricopeptide (TPR) repeat protein
MNCRSVLFAISLSFALTSTAVAKVSPWTEVRSPHFTVLTNGSDADGRHAAHEFEQMRYVFASRFENLRLESGAPLTIFVARDENTAKSLEPRIWKGKGAKPAGWFKHGWEKQYAMIRLDTQTTGVNSYAVVYHEYTHSILRMNAHWLPTWLDEGMAEFYAYTRFQGPKILLGAPTDRQINREQPIIPLRTLLEITQSSPYYHDEDKVNQFYFESWALVHYLTFGSGMGNGEKLNQFFRELQTGTEQEQAFRQVFGSLDEVEKGLDESTRLLAVTAAVIPDESHVDEKTFTVKKLTVAETEAELAGYHLWGHDLASARPLVQQALTDDPKLGLAHEENGFLLFADGEDAPAAEEFSQAYSLDPSLYLSLFAKTMLSPLATSTVPADEEAFHAALSQIASLDGQFAPAYIQLARLSIRQNDLASAFALSRKAEELEPWRAGYHLLTGQILLRMGKGTQTAQDAEFVAKHWSGPDRSEAVELWNAIPAAQRPSGVPLVEQFTLPDVNRAEGTIQSAVCGGKDQPWTLVIRSNDQTLTFHAKGPFEFGFSDTLWYGEDHVSTCRHIQGLRAIVRYHPIVNASYTGDAVEVEVRDDLPRSVSAGEKAGPPAQH